MLASWGRLAGAVRVGSDGPAEVGTVVAMLRRTGRPYRVDDQRIRSVVGTPIVVRGRLWGATVVLAEEEPLPGGTEGRVGEFTELVATAIAIFEARSELAASRARIVEAADEQRRRLVRDLHDGAQARLVLTVMNLESARAAGRPAESRQLVEDGLVHARAAIDELGELVRGIHPPILTKRGLAAAVGTLAGRAQVPVQARSRGALPAGGGARRRTSWCPRR